MKRNSMLFTFIFLFANLAASITPSPDLSSLKHAIVSADQTTLVLFDVDDTLIACKDVVLRPSSEGLVNRFLLEHARHINETKLQELYSKMLLARKAECINHETISIISSLQKRGIPTIALTAADAERLGVIESLAHWRIDELKGFGYDFSSAFSDHGTIKFSKHENKTSHPLFMKGILFSSNHPKGDVLEAFLKKINWSPKKIIFIDDKLAYLQSVEQAAKRMGIEFHGFHYSEHLQPSKLDEGLALFQLKHFLENEVWLSDAEAMQKMNLSLTKEEVHAPLPKA